jgi:hypothetical protein
MEGSLKKFVESVKIFQSTVYPTRYFIMDFTQALVIIKHNKEVKTKPNGEPKENKNKDAVKIVPFRSI